MIMKHAIKSVVFIIAVLAMAPISHGEVMLQWFETEWDEMYRRLPEAAAIGYDYLWMPPPTKAPTGLGTKWGNVGYSLYDRFDIGDVPQRGSWATRYGSRGSLNNMIDNAHALDIGIIPDIIMNHNGNGPDIREYPGMVPEDFHLQYEEGHANTLNYKRAPRMDQWTPDGGYGGTMWQDLASLIDIRTEDHPLNGDPKRFTGGNNTPGWNFVDGTSFIRHIGQTNLYPYFDVNPGTYTNENAAEMLFRWIAWLGDAIDYDGLRLDAGKHTPYEFFGWKGSGFLHEAQYNYNQRRGYSDSNNDEADEMFQNYLSERDDALIFAEILSYQGELNYWYGDLDAGVAGNTKNPMRFIDYPLKQRLYDAFNNGNLASLSLGGGGIDPDLGIMYAWGHDEGGPNKIDLAYAYLLTHVGFPMVYFTGNNIVWDDHGRAPDKRTWMIPGYDSQALGDNGNIIPNLVWIHQQFAWGNEWERWADNDYLAYERYDDKNFNDTPDSGEGILVVALNDTGWDNTKTLQTAFQDGTVLHDYTGNNPNTVTVQNGGEATITVPGNFGQGWVCYAPRNADGSPDNVVLWDNGSPAGTLTWVVPGGIHAADKTQQITRITSTNISMDVTFDPVGGAVDSVMVKWGRGVQIHPTNYYDTGNSHVSGGFQLMNQLNSTNWWLSFQIGATNIPEGLNVIKARVFNQRSASLPALFNTFTKVVYVDRRGPEVDVIYPQEGSTIMGDTVMKISNPDYTAYGMTVSVNGGAAETAHEVYKGKWRYALTGLSAGTHTVTVTTTEADWAAARQVINTSIVTRTFTVQDNANSIALNHSNGDSIELPWFKTVVTAGGSPDAVRLYWNGYELPFNDGMYTNTFNGEVILRDHIGNVVTDRLWGAFVNGPNFFEAVRVDGSSTSRVARYVSLNLYGINAIDSDGDSIPDNVEMPFIDSEGAPGADQPWPGDSNNDFIPNYGESWSRLNPYNHSTFYSGQWDDRNDMDGDGYDNAAEVLAGYNEGNIYKYSIYDSGSYPTGGTPQYASSASWTPQYATRGQPLVITYSPNDGPLSNAAQVVAHIGHSAKTLGEWQDVIDTNMTAVGTNWTLTYDVPTNATSVDFVFFDGDSMWDGNNGNDWRAQIAGITNYEFVIDGTLDSTNYLVHGSGMYIWAAANGENLYVATWGVNESSGGNDHFLYVTDELGDASDPASGWNKDGVVFVDTSEKPFITAEGENDWEGWNNISGSVENGSALEGEISLIDAFGYIPEALYIASVAYGTGDDGGILSQGPDVWNSDNNLDIMEFKRVPIASILDSDLNGAFDAGNPQMWTVVNGDTNDANYGLRRTFLDETAGDYLDITVILEPNVGAGDSVSDVELFSNINRRDFADYEEDPSTVSVNSKTTYYRAYPMTDIGGGRYAYTIRVNKCGAYRINARYKVNGGDYVYYTDNGLRRDCAVVASPKKALELTMYEMNPMFIEATNDNFYGRSTFEDMYTVNADRPDVVNTNHFTSLGMNMIWLQPIHPIGSDNRDTDPLTGQAYDPGSPYAVRNYWQVNSVLGDPSTPEQAMQEFTNFVQAMDGAGVGVMLDGTFNHSAWDCEIGSPAVDMFDWATNSTDLIREVRPQWYSKRNKYGEQASYYESSSNNDIAPAPDRIDFGKWNDAADFHFGVYDALVQETALDTNWAWSSKWYSRYLLEEDRFTSHNTYTRELWDYFAYYPIYWLEKSGHVEGSAKSDSYKGIDGLRCDFAQGLPSEFWEYTINKTRSRKWDFIFMAESLDGYREVGGSKRHGVGYRSSRHFDVLNENMVFYWRDNFFSYPYQGSGGPNDPSNPTPETYPTWEAFDTRRNAYDVSPILLNLSSHDEVLPSDNPYAMLYAYAILSTMNGVPMILYGQEAGAQNDESIQVGVPNDDHNFEHYEVNFNKAIPNFKRYNTMKNIWANRDWNLQNIYGRISRARLNSSALKGLNNYFLSRTDTASYDPDIFAVAKYEEPGVSASTQEVVFAFINNDIESSTNRWATFDLDADYQGKNWFGIEAGKNYNIVNLVATNPTQYIWGTDRTGTDIINNGITIGLTGNPYDGEQAQYLRLVDTAVGVSYPDFDNDGIPDYSDPDDDNDGLPDDWEAAHGLDPKDATGINGASGDSDSDGMSNLDEYTAQTKPNDENSLLNMASIQMNGANIEVIWDAVTNVNYEIESSDSLRDNPVSWQSMYLGTALSTNETVSETMTENITSRYYRVRVRP